MKQDPLGRSQVYLVFWISTLSHTGFRYNQTGVSGNRGNRLLGNAIQNAVAVGGPYGFIFIHQQEVSALPFGPLVFCVRDRGFIVPGFEGIDLGQRRADVSSHYLGGWAKGGLTGALPGADLGADTVLNFFITE